MNIRLKKRTMIILIVLIPAVLAGLYFGILRKNTEKPYGQNLIRNGDFASVSGKGPSDWNRSAWFEDTAFTDYDLVTIDGKNCAHIVNHELNDARFYQTVSVEPDSCYWLHGYIKADIPEDDTGRGANLSVGGVYAFSESVKGNDGLWHEINYWGYTGPDQTEADIFVRLGGYSGESTGEAWFRDISLVRVESVPSDGDSDLWYLPQGAYYDGEEGGSGTAAWQLVLYSVIYTLIAVLALRYMRSGMVRESGSDRVKKNAIAVVLFIIALVIRLLVADRVYGYDVDIGCFTSWMSTAGHNGLASFYDTCGFCDYPPGYIIVLWAMNLFGLPSSFIVKLPSVMADIATGALIWVYGRKYTDRKTSLCMTGLYLINPVTVIAGAAWGQSDAVMTLFLILCVLEALRGKWKTALPLYTLSVLIKPQALMFGPLGLIAFVVFVLREVCRKKDKHAALDAGIGVGISVALLVFISLLFKGSRQAGWLLELYAKTMTSYAYVTVNACNSYFIQGLNWLSRENPVSAASILLSAALYLIPSAMFVGIRNRKEMLKTPEGKRSVVLFALFAAVFLLCLLARILSDGFTYTVFGAIMIALGVGICCMLLVLSGNLRHLPLIASCMLMLLFNTGVMMHERYLFPAVALMILACILEKDKRLIAVVIGITVCSLLNIGCVLDRNIRISGAEGHLSAPMCGIVSDMSVLEYLSAAGIYLITGYAAYVTFGLCYAGKRPVPLGQDTQDRISAEEKKETGSDDLFAGLLLSPCDKRTICKWDVLTVGIVTALYACLAFTNLGSMKAPQTGYTTVKPHEEFIFDLGDSYNFKLLYYSGIEWQDSFTFSMQVSDDCENWSEEWLMDTEDGNCFQWKYALNGFAFDGRYIRVDTGDARGLSLNEFLSRDAVTGESIPMTLVSGPAGAEKLCDEPDSLEGEPGWWNSAYFDEIYHARTAYEHLHGLRTYETSHPPLGKVIMSVGIALFGMVPFGWRFMGTMCGVLMLPAVYMLARLLIRKRKYALGAMMVFALDLMHFTQTRIATIDSFVVLFILWSLCFMMLWIRQDYFAAKYWKTFVPLALSGLFMGLSVASKWTGCYNGLGLGVMFFVTVYSRYRQCCRAKDLLGNSKELPGERINCVHNAAENGKKMLLFSILSCLVFFVAVPAVIYYVSYIPYFAYSGGVTVKKVIEAAQGMLSYHSQPGLGMDHYFYSPWYEWLLDIKPMWFWSDSYPLDNGYKATIMTMGNPAVWWGGFIGIVMAVLMTLYSVYIRVKRKDPVRLQGAVKEHSANLLTTMFFAQFLPWMLVPRGTYIYHYFACVPIIIISLMYVFSTLEERQEISAPGNRTIGRFAARYGLLIYILICAALFIAFFPYASGASVSVRWLESVRWFDNWLWY